MNPREKIDQSHRMLEAEGVNRLIDLARLPEQSLNTVRAEAGHLITRLREHHTQAGGISALMHEFSLATEEGVALMCLAEALLRIPDATMRDTLIRDKIVRGHWREHVGHGPSFFVNAASWGLMLTGKLLAPPDHAGLTSALTTLIGKGGEPLIRNAVGLAMRLLGRQFVCGKTIEAALENSQSMLARGYRYSYDMLGEAALTTDDALRYTEAYRHAILAIGQSIQNESRANIYSNAGISIKLSALHPRYSRFQREHVMTELLGRLKALAMLARQQNIGLNIDAEESERLNLSLDLFEALMRDSELQAWDGLGFVVQAYQKRAPDVIDHLVALSRETSGTHQRRIMIRLVKGAYWDSEIKRSQIDGLNDYPVYTRKAHTDVSYQACARKLLHASDVVYPQFATHNAYTLAWVREAARLNDVPETDYEFQCLYGMGQSLYDPLVGKDKLACRIYAPVGRHDTLLAYLVRRLLENGANTSFINRLVDEQTSIDELIGDPVQQALSRMGAPHPYIVLPSNLYEPERRNSNGLDWSNETVLAETGAALNTINKTMWASEPILAIDVGHDGSFIPLCNPAQQDDVVGHYRSSDIGQVSTAVDAALTSRFHLIPALERAEKLKACAGLIEAHRIELISLLIREAGKTLTNAMSEVREAVDFCRYYAAQITQTETHIESARAHSPLVCISPWNFPLAIFSGQIAAALAAGRSVLAKPAEQTPLIATYATKLFHQAGIPREALQLLLGAGETIGAALVAHPAIGGVLFTGSLPVAKAIQRQLAQRKDKAARDLVLIAETGGLNTMLVDSSALIEQVVNDVVSSAFDSAGQRCSALRVLCIQEEIYERTLTMLRGAMQELHVGNPYRLDTDIGPIIDKQACENLNFYINTMREKGFAIFQPALTDNCSNGNFVAPTLIEIHQLSDVPGEIFGPVLHVMRYSSGQRETLIDQINATGYGLTMGLHSRIDQHLEQLAHASHAGNLYINRNMIGAVVGVQPFGGRGLSGTGPKAGGPLYLAALGIPITESLSSALVKRRPIQLTGPTGESNTLHFSGRPHIGCIAEDEQDLAAQIRAVELVGATPYSKVEYGQHLTLTDDTSLDALLIAGSDALLQSWRIRIAEKFPAIIPVIPWDRQTDPAKELWRLMHEQSISINTTAAGGNTSLITLDDDFEA